MVRSAASRLRWVRSPDRRCMVRLDRHPDQVRERRDDGGFVRESFEGGCARDTRGVGGFLCKRVLRGGASVRESFEGGGVSVCKLLVLENGLRKFLA
jgi:hypothetical protein